LGFFDCDAIFSATFVLILTVVFDSACQDKGKINPSPGLGEALESLQCLADNNNMTAIERLQEIHNVWHHLPEHLRTNESTVTPSLARSQLASDSIDQPADDNRQRPIVHGSTELPDSNEVTDNTAQPVPNPGQPSHLDPDLHIVARDNMNLRVDAEHPAPDLSNMSQVWMHSSASTGTVPGDDLILMDILMDEYYGYFQSLSDNSDWYLTGEDVGDLAEFGRHVVNFSRSE
jgi:proline utilization trans-activator